MSDELRWVLIIGGALVIGGVLLHGLWSIRKNDSRTLVQEPSEAPNKDDVASATTKSAAIESQVDAKLHVNDEPELGDLSITIDDDEPQPEVADEPEQAEDERFQLGNRNKHQDAFFGEVESFTSRYTVDEAEQLLNDGGVPCSRYNSPSDLFSHPQLTERSSFKQFEDDTSTFLVQNAPYLLNGCDISTTPTNPALGEHTLEIFSKNWDQATLDNWRAEGVVGFPD